MSYQRGITRLYVVAAVVWVIWSLYRPVSEHRQQAIKLLNSASVRMGDCYRAKGDAEIAGRGSPDPEDRCGKQYGREAAIAYRMLGESPLETYRSNIVSVAAECVLPPAGGGILLVSLFWAARGFRPPA